MEQRTKVRVLRNNATEPERRLWAQLGARKVAGVRFNRQVSIGPFICDFVARSAALVIEVDGDDHAVIEEADRTRTAYLERAGYRVFRFANADVMGNLEGVVRVISDVLASLPSPDPSRKRKGNSAP